MPDLHHAYLLAAATTRFGRHEGRSALDLMAEAANAALAQSACGAPISTACCAATPPPFRT